MIFQYVYSGNSVIIKGTRYAFDSLFGISIVIGFGPITAEPSSAYPL